MLLDVVAGRSETDGLPGDDVRDDVVALIEDWS
jgi:hypothetical protein